MPDDATFTFKPADKRFKGWLFAGGRDKSKIDLDRLDPDSKPFSTGDKEVDKALAEKIALELGELQERFYADGRWKLLVVLQGMDTSGKDGTIRGVFSGMTPLALRTHPFKAPSENELAHDYLWRIHAQVPRKGEIAIFNRSHYEDVLVPVVKGWIAKEETERRHAHLRDFERMLAETGTVIIKCLLHISKVEQARRLQERLDDPTKHWKFQLGDLEARKQWDDYQRAYEAALAATAAPWAPWLVVPADSKSHRNLMVATLLRDVMQGLDLRYPKPDFDPKLIKIE